MTQLALYQGLDELTPWVPCAFGAVPVKPTGDVISQPTHGLFGAIDVVPATWEASEPDGLTCDAVVNRIERCSAAPVPGRGPGQGMRFTARPTAASDETVAIRECVLFFQDGLNHWDAATQMRAVWADGAGPLPAADLAAVQMVPDCAVCDDSYDRGEAGVSHHAPALRRALRSLTGASVEESDELNRHVVPPDWPLADLGQPPLAAAALGLAGPAAATDADDLKPALQARAEFRGLDGRLISAVAPDEPVVLRVAITSGFTADPHAGLTLFGWLRRGDGSDLPCGEAAEAFLRTGRLPLGTILLTEHRAFVVSDLDFSLASANVRGAGTFRTMPSALRADPAGRRFLLALPGAGQVVAVDATGRHHVLAEGLDAPHDVAPLPGGAVAIRDGSGRLIRLDADGARTPLADGIREIRPAGVPRLVATLDRSFREGPRGIFETVTSLPRPGRFELVATTGLGALGFCAEVPVAEPHAPGPAQAPGRITARPEGDAVRLALSGPDGQPRAGLTGRVTFSALAGGWRAGAAGHRCRGAVAGSLRAAPPRRHRRPARDRRPRPFPPAAAGDGSMRQALSAVLLSLALALPAGAAGPGHDHTAHDRAMHATAAAVISDEERLALPDLPVTLAGGRTGGFRSLLPERAPIILSFTCTGCESLCGITNAILLGVDERLAAALADRLRAAESQAIVSYRRTRPTGLAPLSSAGDLAQKARPTLALAPAHAAAGRDRHLPPAGLHAYLDGLILGEALIACGRGLTRICLYDRLARVEIARFLGGHASGD